MIKLKTGGSIVLVASISGHVINFPQPQAAYNTAKSAVMHMTRCFAAEWAVHGIRVNSISPGYMDTVLNEGDALEGPREMWRSRTPMGRMGKPNELDGAALLLCSAAGSYITGSDIRVDGKNWTLIPGVLVLT
jgi:sorbose reductase